MSEIKITNEEYAILEMAKLYAQEKLQRTNETSRVNLYQNMYNNCYKELNQLKAKQQEDAERLHAKAEAGETAESQEETSKKD